MITVTIQGTIEKGYTDNWYTIKIIQDDGYKIDLVNRIREATENFPGKDVQLNYYISDKLCSKGEMLEGWLKKLHGNIDAAYEANGYHYSSWTWGTDYDTVLKIGGHNLLNELYSYEGKYIILELNFKTP